LERRVGTADTGALSPQMWDSDVEMRHRDVPIQHLWDLARRTAQQ
jgi:hypothetical protein